MTTPAQLPGLTSEHEFFSPIDENFERDMEAAFRRATRGEIVLTPTTWQMGPYHTLEFDRARRGVPMLPMDQALNNPGGPWGGVKGSVGSPLDRRGLRGLGQIDPETGRMGMVMLGGGLLAAWALWMFTKNRESAFV